MNDIWFFVSMALVILLACFGTFRLGFWMGQHNAEMKRRSDEHDVFSERVKGDIERVRKGMQL